MTPPYTMHSVQSFTAHGKLGIWLLMGSPLVSGAAYAGLLHELAAHNQTLFMPSVLLILSGLAFIAGALLALIGREQTTTVTPVVAYKSSDYTAENWGKQPNGSETYDQVNRRADEANRRAAELRSRLRQENEAAYGRNSR